MCTALPWKILLCDLSKRSCKKGEWCLRQELQKHRTVEFSIVGCSWAIITLPTPFQRYIFLLLASFHDYVRMFIFKARLHSHVRFVIAKLLQHSIFFLINVQIFECFVHIHLCRDLCMILFCIPTCAKCVYINVAVCHPCLQVTV